MYFRSMMSFIFRHLTFMAKAIKSYRDLEVWRKSMDFVEAVYDLAKRLPDSERYCLTSQLCRASISIPSNIAEGYGRSGRKDYLRHLGIARGSLMELETQLALAARLKYTDRQTAMDLWKQAQEIGKMLNGLVTSLRQGVDKRSPHHSRRDSDLES